MVYGAVGLEREGEECIFNLAVPPMRLEGAVLSVLQVSHGVGGVVKGENKMTVS
jgi:hypothetical protein